MIEEQVRYLLENRTKIIENLAKISQLMLSDESEREIIEALVLTAKNFKPDPVQSQSTTAEDQMLRLIKQKNRQKHEQRDARSMVMWVAESQAQEIEMLDAAVSLLHANQARVIVARYYEGRSCDECAAVLGYSRVNVSRITQKAIRDLSEKMIPNVT